MLSAKLGPEDPSIVDEDVGNAVIHDSHSNRIINRTEFDRSTLLQCYGLDQYDWLELVSWGKDLVRRRCARRENDLDSDSEVGEL